MVIRKLEEIQKTSNTGVSFRRPGVLGGVAAIEKAAGDAGYDVTVPFHAGRGDATQDMTDTNPSRIWNRSPTASATISAGRALPAEFQRSTGPTC